MSIQAEPQRVQLYLETAAPPASITPHAAPRSGFTVVVNTQPSDNPQTITINLEGHAFLPKPDDKTSLGTSDPKKAIESLEEQEKCGKAIPSGLKKLTETLQKGLKWTLWGVGLILLVIGLALLIGGTIYTCYVLGKSSSQFAELGVFGVVTALIKSGALPSVLVGGALIHFGRGLMKNDLSTGSLLSFVTPFYSLLYPMEVTTTNATQENPWLPTK